MKKKLQNLKNILKNFFLRCLTLNFVPLEQLYALRRLMQGSEQTPKAPLGNNARPVQNLHHRTVRTNIDFKQSKVRENSLHKTFVISLNCERVFRQAFCNISIDWQTLQMSRDYCSVRKAHKVITENHLKIEDDFKLNWQPIYISVTIYVPLANTMIRLQESHKTKVSCK